MKISKMIAGSVFALGALLPGAGNAAGVLGATLGMHFYGYNEKDSFGFADLSGHGGGNGLTYQVLAGFGSSQVSFYGTYIGVKYSANKPTEGGDGDVDKSLSLLGAGLNIYFADLSKQGPVPYMILGGGTLFHSEDDVYMGRGGGFFGGLGIRLVPHFGIEARYFGGSATESERSLSFNSFQIVGVLSTN